MKEKKSVLNSGAKKIDYRAQGKRNRAAGLRFEAKVRAKLEEMGWTVDKWTNTVDYEKLKLVPAKRKFNPFSRVMVIGTGFPDFVAIKRFGESYEVIGVEVKLKGYLDKIEQGMAHFLVENKIFSKFLIAVSKREGRKISVEFIDFSEYYNREKERKYTKKIVDLS
jgi:hypothetical protein